MSNPKYPLTVKYYENDVLVESVIVNDEIDACTQLEWLDTDDQNDPVDVTDALGRKVRLKIFELDIKLCEILE